MNTKSYALELAAQRVPQHELGVVDVGQLDDRAGQVGRRRAARESRRSPSPVDLGRAVAAAEQPVDRPLGARGLDAQPAGGVALRIEIDEQHLGAGLGEAGGDVDGGGRLADAALLVGDGDDASHGKWARAVVRGDAVEGWAQTLMAVAILPAAPDAGQRRVTPSAGIGRAAASAPDPRAAGSSRDTARPSRTRHRPSDRGASGGAARCGGRRGRRLRPRPRRPPTPLRRRAALVRQQHAARFSSGAASSTTVASEPTALATHDVVDSRSALPGAASRSLRSQATRARAASPSSSTTPATNSHFRRTESTSVISMPGSARAAARPARRCRSPGRASAPAHAASPRRRRAAPARHRPARAAACEPWAPVTLAPV